MSQKVHSQYVSTQEEHHKRVTFQDEDRAFLKRHHVSFDEWRDWSNWCPNNSSALTGLPV
jgi:hypothetical protein